MREEAEQATRPADESDLCRVWATQAFVPATPLTTTGGEPLQVVYPGRRMGTAGPDFRGALLADGAGRLRSGDVEVHLRGRDWITHGHRADPAYNGVILHVVLEDDGVPCVRADGVPVPILAIGSRLTWPLPAARAAPHPAQCRVASALSARDVQRIVGAAGRERLGGKAAALEAQAEILGPEQALFVALLDAAGYSRNRAPCAALAERLPVEQLQHLLAGKGPSEAVALATAVLLGLAGLLIATGDATLQAVWERYADLWPLPPLPRDAWVRAGVRPANRPEARLRGLAHLVARTARDGLVAALTEPIPVGDADALLTRLEVTQPGAHAALIGRGRALEIAINVVVPFTLAMARSRDDRELEDCSWRLAASLPGGDDAEPLRHMRALLAASGHRLRPYHALEQQGLLHLYRSYCSVAACWECPLGAGS